VRKAEADYRLAKKLARGSEPFRDQLCFHCQQSAEKYLKALLEELGIAVAKTHDLKKLFTVLQPHYPELRSVKRGLVFLTQFAVETRYPGRSANKRESEAAFRWAERIRTSARTILKLPLHPPRKKK
jgi:HEPN domain-containing protein